MSKNNSCEDKQYREISNQEASFRMLDDSEDEGMFEGYITVWNTVDSYNSTFQRGAFKKTIKERGDKIKVFFNHKDLIGNVIEIREDDKGVFVRGKINLQVQAANDVFQFIKDGTLEGLSFAFRTIKRTFKEGIETITEVKLFEVGPVIFPANDDALITESRAVDFDDSLEMKEKNEKPLAIMEALHTTLSDIWWKEQLDNSRKIALFDEAISKFNSAYVEAATYIFNMSSAESMRNACFVNDLQREVILCMNERGETLEQISQNTRFTVEELNQLRSGKTIENKENLSQLSDVVASMHRKQRNESVEELCKHLRGLLTQPEKIRINSLLGLAERDTCSHQHDNSFSKISDYFKSQQISGDKNE